MTDELNRLIAEKKELERRISQLQSGTVIHETVKIDRISFAGKYQRGKWALFYKYAHTVSRGRTGNPEARTRWVPFINGESFEELTGKIPEVIKALTELYEEAKKHGTDS